MLLWKGKNIAKERRVIPDPIDDRKCTRKKEETKGKKMCLQRVGNYWTERKTERALERDNSCCLRKRCRL